MHSLPPVGVGCIVLLTALVALAPAWAGDPSGEPGTHLSPEAAVAAALETHPLVLQAEATLGAATGSRAAATWLRHNPEVALQSSLDGARAEASISQPLSLTGAGWHDRAAAAGALDAALLELQRARLAAAADTRRTYSAATVAARSATVAAEGVELAARLGRAVTRQHEEGEASALDVRLARLAEVQAAATLLDAREVEALALQALAEQVGRPVQSASLARDPLAAAPESASSVAASRSDVAATQDRLRAAQAELRLQRAASLPPVSVGVFAAIEDGQSSVGPTIGLALPLFQRNQAGRAGAVAQVQVAEAAVVSVAARAETELATARHRVAEAAVLAERLVADPLAEAQAALVSIEAGYLAGEIDLPSTVLLQAQVLEGEAAAIELLGHVARARIDLLLATEDPALIGGAP